jgi:hypothetical protein
MSSWPARSAGERPSTIDPTHDRVLGDGAGGVVAVPGGPDARVGAELRTAPLEVDAGVVAGEGGALGAAVHEVRGSDIPMMQESARRPDRHVDPETC